MVRNFLAFAMLCAACATAEPAPVLAVSEESGWGGLASGDIPVLVVYDDGAVIFQSEKPTIREPFYCRNVEHPKAFTKKLLGCNLTMAQRHYDLCAATDQLTTTIWTAGNTVSVYGDWRKALTVEGDPPMEGKNKHEKQLRVELPPEIRRFLTRIDEQRKLKGKPWLPPAIEVIFSPYPKTLGEPMTIAWPEYWPGLDAMGSRKTGEDSYSVYVSPKSLPGLDRFPANRKNEFWAVLINGRKYKYAFRFPFPGEAAWVK